MSEEKEVKLGNYYGYPLIGKVSYQGGMRFQKHMDSSKIKRSTILVIGMNYLMRII